MHYSTYCDLAVNVLCKLINIIVFGNVAPYSSGVLKRQTAVHNLDRQDASGGPRLASVKVKNSTIKMPKLTYSLTTVSHLGLPSVTITF